MDSDERQTLWATVAILVACLSLVVAIVLLVPTGGHGHVDTTTTACTTLSLPPTTRSAR